MQTIQILDPVTVTKIKAGEVIDRPANIVKELIENSLDAGATSVCVDIERGGIKTIKISDNGSGISKADLPLAPKAHATSKLTQFAQLDQLSSYGFRGEALSAICHVAKLTITSKQSGFPGYTVSAYQDHIGTVEPAAHPDGTQILVEDLFHDIPVRKKFLKSPGTETSHVLDVVVRFALIHPDKDFVLMSDHKELFNSTGISDQQALIVSIYGKDLKGHLYPVDAVIDGMSVRGVISDPSISFSNRNKQILAVNDRIIKSPILQRAIQQAYRDIMVPNRFALAVLNIALGTGGVDVNIHPQKQDVKFINPSMIFEVVPKAIKASLVTHHADVTVGASFSEVAGRSPQQVVQYAGSSRGNWPSAVAVSTMTESAGRSTPYSGNQDKAESNWQQSVMVAPVVGDLTDSFPDYFQIYETYIVIKSADGIYILDQHAVHERILYERIKTDVAPKLDAQTLLISEVVDLSPDQMAVFRQEQRNLQSIQFEIDEFGPTQVVFRQVPAPFVDAPLKQLLTDMLDHLKDLPGGHTDLTLAQKEVLQMKACKAAIKAGKRLADAEVRQLIKDFQASPANFTCPHGRPLFIKLDKAKLERMFLRA